MRRFLRWAVLARDPDDEPSAPFLEDRFLRGLAILTAALVVLMVPLTIWAIRADARECPRWVMTTVDGPGYPVTTSSIRSHCEGK